MQIYGWSEWFARRESRIVEKLFGLGITTPSHDSPATTEQPSRDSPANGFPCFNQRLSSMSKSLVTVLTWASLIFSLIWYLKLWTLVLYKSIIILNHIKSIKYNKYTCIHIVFNKKLLFILRSWGCELNQCELESWCYTSTAPLCRSNRLAPRSFDVCMWLNDLWFIFLVSGNRWNSA